MILLRVGFWHGPRFMFPRTFHHPWVNILILIWTYATLNLIFSACSQLLLYMWTGVIPRISIPRSWSTSTADNRSVLSFLCPFRITACGHLMTVLPPGKRALLQVWHSFGYWRHRLRCASCLRRYYLCVLPWCIWTEMFLVVCLHQRGKSLTLSHPRFVALLDYD